MDLLFTVCVTQRSSFTTLAGIFKKTEVPFNTVALGRGTASSERLNMMGLDDTEKVICFSVLTPSIWKKMKKMLRGELQIDLPGAGVAFTVPLAAVAGKTALRVLTRNTDFTRGDEGTLKNTVYELIVAVCEQGYSHKVMEAAKKGGAGGGTVIRARGTGVHSAEQFLGITLTGEKDMIFIVSKTAEKKAIMEAIVREAGPESRAKAIAFSLPVTDTAGLRLLEPDEDEQEAQEAQPEAAQ
jgi:nitrogen regulatory protein PII